MPPSTIGVRYSPRLHDHAAATFTLDDQADQQRVDQQAGVGRADALDGLEVAREQQHAGEQPEGAERAGDEDRAGAAVGEQRTAG